MEPHPRSRTSHATAPGGHPHPDDCPLRHTTDAEAMRDEAMLCSSNRGILVRTPGGDIGVVDRNTEGVRPIDLLEDERLVGMEGFEDYEQG
jgi:DNA gyrase/topoisomerase IV subunit A